MMTCGCLVCSCEDAETLRAEVDRLEFEYLRADESAKRLGSKWKERGLEIERLGLLLAERDRYIVEQGLWDDFVKEFGEQKSPA